MKYSDKLKDPRWQKKRLEVLDQRDWRCEICSDTEQTLHVHHDKYIGEPWECPSDELFVLCDECHCKVHNAKIKAREWIIANNNLDFAIFYQSFFETMEENTDMPSGEILKLCIAVFNKYDYISALENRVI